MLRAAVTALLALVLAACGGSEAAEQADLTGKPVDPPFEVAGTPLLGADGQPYSLSDDTTKPLTLVFFGYTNCPDICGQVMMTLAGAMTRLSEADREQVDVVFVTTDPARDTGEVVEDYVTQFDREFVGLTGDLDDIVAIGRSVGVGIDQGEKLPNGGYEVTHGTQVMAVDADDQVPLYWSQDVSQAQLADDLHRLLSDEG